MPFTSNELVAAKDIVCRSAEFYGDKDERVQALSRTVLFSHEHTLYTRPSLASNKVSVDLTRFCPCPALNSTGNNMVNPEYVEVKNEIGTGQSDAIAQGT